VLGENQYRRSEQSWREAGKPTATVSIAAERDAVVVTVDVTKPDLSFAPRRGANVLDNENPDTNSDGVQLHVIVPASPTAPSSPREFTWLMVPEAGSDRVRVSGRALGAPDPGVRASWHSTRDGYVLRAELPRSVLDGHGDFLLGVVVNETVPDRERRRGQLVLGGPSGEFIYLRGDRLPIERHLAFVIANA
jgi:hypothetical protein